MKTERNLIEVEEHDDVTVLRLAATDFVQEQEARALGSQLGDWLTKEGLGARVVLSLAKVTYLNSSALGSLLVFEVKLKRRGGELKLCGLSPQVAEVFRITKLDRLFEVYRTEAEALLAFGARAK
ncbi:MAG: STAS domain-containing protein [Planctomycetes bacterium]|nr:STAS domain-containing protein [Planctomycetota bacterium]